MIINIPINLDEHILEGKIQEDFDKKFEEVIMRKFVEVLNKEAGYSYTVQNRKEDGMKNLVKDRIDEYIDEHSDEIIDVAVKRLADRLANRKKIKEVANEKA